MRGSSLKIAVLAGLPLALMSTSAYAQDAPKSDAPPAPSASPAPTPTPAPAAAAPAAPAEGTVMVHVNSPKPVSLERRANSGVAWEHACEAPCDQRFSVGDQFRIVGTDLNDSEPFVLDASRGDKLTLEVYPGEIKKQRIGTYILIGGGALFLGGLVGGLIAAHPGNTFTTDGTTNNSNFTAIILGTTIAVVGLSGMIFGGAWLINNGHSYVGGDVQGSGPARGDLGPSHLTGIRTPAPTTPTATVPIFQGTF